MAEETRVFTRRNPRRVVGLAALALSVAGGAAFLGLVALVGLLDWAVGSPTGEVDAPGLALLLLPLQAACFLAVFAALGLSAIALVRPGTGWPAPAAAWMVGVAALWFAGAQEVVWTPLGGGADPERVPPEAAALDAADPDAGARQYGPFGPGVAPRPGTGQASPVGPEGVEERMMEEAFAGPGALPEEGFGAPPARPPDAILAANGRDAVAFEGTFCWAPEWAADCVEDAGIPLLPAQDTVAVRRGEAAGLPFVLTGSEASLTEEPVATSVVAYPLDQEARTVRTAMGIGYLVPGGGKRTLEKEYLAVREGVDGQEVVVPEDGVPEGEYAVQVSARPPQGSHAAWSRATYHFRLLVLPERDR